MFNILSTMYVLSFVIDEEQDEEQDEEEEQSYCTRVCYLNYILMP